MRTPRTRAYDTLIGFSWLTGLFGLSLLFTYSLPQKNSSFSFDWPSDQGVRFHLKGTLTLSHQDPFQQALDAYPFTLSLEAHPTSGYSSPQPYRVSIQQLSLKNSSGHTLISLDHSSAGTWHYHIDPQIPLEQRQSICDTLKITESTSALDDFSLLRSPFYIALSSKGSLEECSLPSSWKKPLLDELHAHPFFSLLQTLFTDPETLPSLGPITSSRQEEALLAIPGDFHYNIQRESEAELEVGISSETNQRTFAQKVSGKYSYYKPHKLLKELELKIDLQREQKLYSSSVQDALELDFSLSCKLIPKKKPVEVVDIEEELGFRS